MMNIVPGTVGTEAVVQLVGRGGRVLAVTAVVWRKVHVVPGRFTVVTFPFNKLNIDSVARVFVRRLFFLRHLNSIIKSHQSSGRNVSPSEGALATARYV